MNKIGVRWSLMFLCLLSLACRKNRDAAAYTVHMAVSHFVLNADSVSVLYDGSKVTGTRSLNYGATTSLNGQDYLTLGAGTHTIQIVTGGAVVKENTISSVAGKYYSLFLYDSIINGKLKSALVENQIVPVDTLTQVRFINVVPGADTLRVLFTKDMLAGRISDVYIGNRSAPAYPFASIRPGSWKVSLIRGSSIIVQPADFQLKAGKLYTFIAKGLKNGTGVYKESIVVVPNN